VRLRPLRILYQSFEAATPWIAASEFLAGVAMAILTGVSATPWVELFEFNRADAFLGALAAWLVLAHEGFDMGRDYVLDEEEERTA